jgi:hypothetical protein
VSNEAVIRELLDLICRDSLEAPLDDVVNVWPSGDQVAGYFKALDAEVGRLVEARDTAQRSLQAVEQQRQWRAAERDRAEAERDAAIQERDRAEQGREWQYEKARDWAKRCYAVEERLERVEAALREAESWIATLPEGRPDSQATCAYVPKAVTDRLAAALSDVTPPPSELCSACGAPGALLDEVQECPAIKRDSAGTCLWKARSAAGAVDE